MMSCYSHGFPKLYLAIRLNHSTLAAGLSRNILCPYRSVVDRSYICASVRRVPLENITYEFVSSHPAVSRTSCSYNLDCL